MTDIAKLLDELRKPFHPSHVTWKPGAVKGERALALAYADLRAYMNRLDEVCGSDWSVAYEPWGEDRIICRLTIAGVTRSSTGETTNEAEKGEIGGTVAEAQAFKRAAAMFGLGRYLYTLPTGWADYDKTTRRFTDKAKARLTGILVQHYRRATDGKDPETMDSVINGANGDADDDKPEPSPLLNEFNALGKSLYAEQWPDVRQHNAKRVSGGKTTDAAELTTEQVQQLIDGMNKVREKREPVQDAPAPSQNAQESVNGDGTLDSTQSAAYAHLIDKLTGDCLERANRARKIHAQSRGGASPEQYRFLAGTIDNLVRQPGGHKPILEVFVGRAVSSANPPGAQLAGKLLDALLETRTVERDGEKVKEDNPDYNPEAVACVHSIYNLVRELDGQASLFDQPEAQAA